MTPNYWEIIASALIVEDSYLTAVSFVSIRQSFLEDNEASTTDVADDWRHQGSVIGVQKTVVRA